MTKLLNYLTIGCDAARPWGVYFQDTASPQMEALMELHDNIMFYLVIILFGVAWILISVIRNYTYNKSPISNKYLNHGTLIELIWTITPALILILIAFPSFKLFYLMDEITDPSLTVFVKDHCWYWSYQYPDFLNDDEEELGFYSHSAHVLDSEEEYLTTLSMDDNAINSTSTNEYSSKYSAANEKWAMNLEVNILETSTDTATHRSFVLSDMNDKGGTGLGEVCLENAKFIDVEFSKPDTQRVFEQARGICIDESLKQGDKVKIIFDRSRFDYFGHKGFIGSYSKPIEPHSVGESTISYLIKIRSDSVAKEV